MQDSMLSIGEKTFQLILKVQREACGRIIFVSQGFRGSCLEGKLIAEFTKQAWNVCLISPEQSLERLPLLVVEVPAGWPRVGVWSGLPALGAV